MYLETFEERTMPSGGANRRRYPRVKPDAFGRFDPDELNRELVVVEDEAGPGLAWSRLKSPWLMAAAGMFVGAIVSAMVTNSLLGGRAPGAVASQNPVAATSAPLVIDPPARATTEAEATRKPPASNASLPVAQTPVSAAVVAALAKEQAEPARREISGTLRASPESDGAMVAMPGPEEDGALSVLDDEASGDAAAAVLVVLQ